MLWLFSVANSFKYSYSSFLLSFLLNPFILSAPNSYETFTPLIFANFWGPHPPINGNVWWFHYENVASPYKWLVSFYIICFSFVMRKHALIFTFTISLKNVWITTSDSFFNKLILLRSEINSSLTLVILSITSQLNAGLLK